MSDRVPREVALAGFHKAQEQAVKAMPLYDQCVAIYRAMRAEALNHDNRSEERKRRASGPSSIGWPFEDPLAKYKQTPSPSHAETVAPYAAALRMIRDAVGELFGPVSDLESEEAVLLRGPEPHHEAEAIIAGLQRVKERTGAPAPAELESIVDRVIERCRNLHKYAGRPAWDAVLREELATFLTDAQAAIAAKDRHIELLQERDKCCCACSYDRPDDVCLGHSPKLKAAEARVAELLEEVRQLREGK